MACHDSDSVYVLGADGGLLATIDLPRGSGPLVVGLVADLTRQSIDVHELDLTSP